jgi:uncharacterized protein YcbK (DUF882 family)
MTDQKTDELAPSELKTNPKTGDPVLTDPANIGKDGPSAAERALANKTTLSPKDTPADLGISHAEKNAQDAGIVDGIELVTVLVEIKKKTNSVGDVVAEHEVPILRHMHKEENVKIVDREYGTIVLENNALAELERLRRKYDDQHTRVVQAVYGNSVDRIARVTGMNDDVDVTAEVTSPDQSVQVDKTRARAKAAAKKAASNKKPAAKKTVR